jgi:hypothetical protein
MIISIVIHFVLFQRCQEPHRAQLRYPLLALETE